jgi:hypothetical protein
MPRQYCELSLSRIGASGSQPPPAGMRVRCNSMILPEAPPRRKPHCQWQVVPRVYSTSKSNPQTWQAGNLLAVVLQFLTQPGSQYIFAPFAVAPIGQLYLGRSAHCACCRRSWSMGNGGGLLRTCCSTPWDSSSCLSAPYLHAWIGLRSPGADVAAVSPVPAQMWRG